MFLWTACVFHTPQRPGSSPLTLWTFRVAPLNCCSPSTAAWWVTMTTIRHTNWIMVWLTVFIIWSCLHRFLCSPLSQDMSESSGCGQLLVKARFPFQQTNEDELSFSKGDIISVSKQEDGGWWEGSLNGKSGWFPSNYVRELKGSGGCSTWCFRRFISSVLSFKTRYVLALRLVSAGCTYESLKQTVSLCEERRQERRKEAPQAHKDRKFQSCYIERNFLT